MNKFILGLILIIIAPAMTWGATASIKRTVNEGTTAVLTVSFVDDNGLAVIPEKVWYFVDNGSSVITQNTQSCEDGKCAATLPTANYTQTPGTPGPWAYPTLLVESYCPSSFFQAARGSHRTDSTMQFTLFPVANRSVGSGSGRERRVSVYFNYPDDCGAANNSTTCKWGTGAATYDVNMLGGVCVLISSAGATGEISTDETSVNGCATVNATLSPIDQGGGQETPPPTFGGIQTPAAPRYNFCLGTPEI